MKRLFLILFLSAISHVCFSQQLVKIDNQFTGLELIGAMEVEIISDTICDVEMTAYGFDIQRVKWTQKGGILTITAPIGVFGGGDLKVKIRAAELTNLVCDGCTISSKTALISNSLNVYSLSSTNNLNLNIDVENLKLNLAGKSVLNLSGSAVWASVNVTMGSKLEAINAEFENCNIIVSGASEATINVVENLDAKVNTSATLYYKGNPKAKFKTATWGRVQPIPTID